MNINTEKTNNYRPDGISVVIPNYNGRILLEENLPLLNQALQLANVPYEIIVPDDASTDDSLKFLRENYSWITIIEHPTNRGFAPNINSGIFKAKYELVFLMNSDVSLMGDYFSKQFPYFERPDTFGVMGRIEGVGNTNIQDAAKRKESSFLKISANKNVVPLYPDSYNFPSFFLSGANALVNRQKLTQIGGFDEIFAPFYGEDLELCFRAWKLGWRCYYHHEAICKHPNSVTIKKYHQKKNIQKIVYRNRLIFHAIHLSGISLTLWNILNIIKVIAYTLVFKDTFLKAYIDFRKLRKAVQSSKNRFRDLSLATNIRISNYQVIRLIHQTQNKLGFRYI